MKPSYSKEGEDNRIDPAKGGGGSRGVTKPRSWIECDKKRPSVAGGTRTYYS